MMFLSCLSEVYGQLTRLSSIHLIYFLACILMSIDNLLFLPMREFEPRFIMKMFPLEIQQSEQRTNASSLSPQAINEIKTDDGPDRQLPVGKAWW